MGLRMRVFIGGECRPENLFSLVDPTEFSEAEFETHVYSALKCVYKDYYCIPFGGSFEFDGDVKVADLALIHKTFSHWFVIEVELVSHSLHNHVVPQVRCFQYGKPRNTCIQYLCRYIPGCSEAQAQTLMNFVPRSVAVVANRTEPEWVNALRSVNVQFMAVSVFKGHDDRFAFETDGSLNVPHVSLGFFTYSAATRTIRMDRSCGMPEGVVQIEDPYGSVGLWTVRGSEDALWVTKNLGDPGFRDRVLLQVLRTQTGKLTLRLPTAPS